MNITWSFFLKKLWSICYHTHITDLLSDVVFAKVLYLCYTNKQLDLKNPVDFNQKIQWLKLYYHNHKYIECADKYAVRTYVKEHIGEQYLNKCIGVYDEVDEIKFEKLPNSFVLKATHASGRNFVCQDKTSLDICKVKKMLKKWLHEDFYKVGREWQYHRIQPRIICEAFMQENDGSTLRDYKLFTFKGVTKYVTVEFKNNEGKDCINVFDSNGVLQKNKRWDLPADERTLNELPKCFVKMKELAYKLAHEFPMCRVDLYVLGGEQIVFGELTFTPGKGCNAIYPQSFCDELGSYIELPQKRQED